MKITTEDGQEFELVENERDGNSKDIHYTLKPVKKTEKKKYRLLFYEDLDEQLNIYTKSFELTELTPKAAQKLSEAISALVEYVQSSEFDKKKYEILQETTEEAWVAYQESQ